MNFLKPYFIGQTQNSISRRVTEPEMIENVSCIKKFNNVKKQKSIRSINNIKIKTMYQ